MRRFMTGLWLGLLSAGSVAQPQPQPQTPAQVQAQPQTTHADATPRAPSTAEAAPAATAATPAAAAPITDHASLGRALLNAGPDARVRLDGSSRDHAAIFGTADENEQALMDQERSLQTQRDQLRMLEKLLTERPAAADPHPPAMIPLNAGAPMNMPKLAPTPSGSQLDRTGSDTRRSVDEMQRRVNGLRRDADDLGNRGR